MSAEEFAALVERVAAIEAHDKHHACQRCIVERSRKSLDAHNAAQRKIAKAKADAHREVLRERALANPRVRVRIGDEWVRQGHVEYSGSIRITPGGKTLPESVWRRHLAAPDGYYADLVAKGRIVVEPVPIEEAMKCEEDFLRRHGDESKGERAKREQREARV